MKKILYMVFAVVITASFTACSKDNSVQPTSVKTKTLADDEHAKNDIGQADFAKNDIGQADLN